MSQGFRPANKGIIDMIFIVVSLLEVDINKLKRVIKEVLKSNYANLQQLPQTAVPSLASHLYTNGCISSTVRDKPSIHAFIEEFESTLSFLKEESKIKDHCEKFLKAFRDVGGTCAKAAEVMHTSWDKAF